MSNETWTYIAIGAAGAVSLIAWIGLVLVPAWTSYSRLWERFLATILSFYVLVAMVALGGALGAAVLWYWDDL